jgi:hypothetical protein
MRIGMGAVARMRKWAALRSKGAGLAKERKRVAVTTKAGWETWHETGLWEL